MSHSDCLISFRLTVASQIALLGRPFTPAERQAMEDSAGEHLTGFEPFPKMLADAVEKYTGLKPAEVESEGSQHNVWLGWDVRPVDEEDIERTNKGRLAWILEDTKAKTEPHTFIDDEDEDEPHTCKTCGETMNDANFQEGKMCCDKPMFHDDHEDDEDEQWSEVYNDGGTTGDFEDAGWDSLRPFTYYQTFGGGPEGGYLSDGTFTFVCSRGWHEPWAFGYVPNAQVEVAKRHGVPHIRLVPA